MIAILLVLFGALPQGAAPAPAGIECSTCKATGRALQDCLVCRGSKNVDCPTCQPFSWATRTTELGAATAAPELRESVRQALEALRKLRKTEAETFGEPVRGHTRCPATCIKGKSLLNRGLTCKYCEGKGQLPCARCKKKGELRCGACEGRGRVLRACEDCLGTGRRRDPATIAADARSSCPTCSGRGSWECRECDEKGFVDSACRACNGDGNVPCTKCLGTRQKPCSKCSATGDLSSFLGPKPGNTCNDCHASGHIACDQCERGTVVCPSCKGKRHLPQRCLACQVSHFRPCLGCSRGAYRSWELAGDASLSAGDSEGARAFCEIARGRVEGRYRELANLCQDPQATEKALEKERKAETERLEKRIAVAQAPAK